MKQNSIKHIGFIMDGNRRFSIKNNISKLKGYELGMLQCLNFIKYQIKNNIFETSFYALSTENLKNRNQEELKIIKELILNFFEKKDINNNENNIEDIEEFFKTNKMQLNLIGDIEELEKNNSSIFNFNSIFIKKLKNKINKINKNLNEIKFKVNICINYGGQNEIKNACIKIAKKIKNNEINIEDINEKLIKKNIFFNSSTPPEIIVRPGNVPRLSGFCLWDSQYSEIYLSKKYWPELTENDFKDILNWYSNIQRNFGK